MWSWRRRREAERAEPPLPLLPGEVGNGEFLPAPPTARDRAMAVAIVEGADAAARRLGRSRRSFLQSAGGVALSLAVFQACSSDAARTARRTTSTTGGRFAVPDPLDAEACESVLGSAGELIVDVHTHHVMPAGPWRANAP